MFSGQSKEEKRILETNSIAQKETDEKNCNGCGGREGSVALQTSYGCVKQKSESIAFMKQKNGTYVNESYHDVR